MHGGLDGFDAVGLEKGLGIGQGGVRARPLVPPDAARERVGGGGPR